MLFKISRQKCSENMTIFIHTKITCLIEMIGFDIGAVKNSVYQIII